MKYLTTINLEKSIKDHFQTRAIKEGKTLSEMIEFVLLKELKKHVI